MICFVTLKNSFVNLYIVNYCYRKIRGGRDFIRINKKIERRKKCRLKFLTNDVTPTKRGEKEGKEREREREEKNSVGPMVEVASTSLQKCRFACYIRHAVPRTGERSVVKKKIWMCLIPDSNTHPRLPVPHKFGSSLGKDSDAPHTKTSLVPCSSWLTK